MLFSDSLGAWPPRGKTAQRRAMAVAAHVAGAAGAQGTAGGERAARAAQQQGVTISQDA